MPEPSPDSPETPLDSWKAIAAYLNRDISTVRRWEASEGLPVHRHRHLARSSVYAYPSELDSWRAGRRPERSPAVASASRPRLRTVAVAALAVVMLLAGGDGWMGTPKGPAAQDRGLVAREVWADPTADVSGTPTPDGRFVTFIDWTTGDVAVRDLTTGVSRRITGKGSFATADFGQWPIVSADSTDGAYHYGVRAGTQDVYEAELDPRTGTLSASAERLTHRFEGSNLAGALSPDGRRLAYVSRRGPLLEGPGSMAVVVRALDTGEERDFHSTLHLSGRRPVLRWFPDGESILLTAAEGGTWTLSRIHAETGAVAPLAAGLGTPGYVFQPPSISPNGRTVFYFRPDAGTHEYSLMAYDIDTRRQEELFRSKEALLSLALSRNGRQVAIATSGAPRTVFVMALDGSSRREVFRIEQRARETLSGEGLEWSPDDRFVYFVRSFRDEPTGARDQLWRVPVTGGTPEHILSADGLAFPAISRDGRRLVFTAGRMALAALWVMENAVSIP